MVVGRADLERVYCSYTPLLLQDNKDRYIKHQCARTWVLRMCLDSGDRSPTANPPHSATRSVDPQ